MQKYDDQHDIEFNNINFSFALNSELSSLSFLPFFLMVSIFLHCRPNVFNSFQRGKTKMETKGTKKEREGGPKGPTNH